jgi:hypothetical protein
VSDPERSIIDTIRTQCRPVVSEFGDRNEMPV